MKNLKYKSVLLIVTSLAIVSCGQETTFSAADKKAVADAVEQTLKQYQRDVSASGLMAEFKYLDDSKDFFWVPGYQAAMPYDSIAKAIRQNARQMKNKRINTIYEKLQIIPLTKEYATYTASLRSVVTDSVGKSVDIRLLETGLMVKRKDGWKLQSGQSTVLP